MRAYANLFSTFWTRGTGRRLRGRAAVQLVAVYLMSCAASTMSGVYYLPLAAVADETGLPLADVEEAFRALSAEAFVDRDPETDLVFVRNLARHQLGDELAPGDKRRLGLVSLLRRVAQLHPGHPFLAAFIRRYGEAYGITPDHIGRGFEGASKGLRRGADSDSFSSDSCFSARTLSPEENTHTPGAGAHTHASERTHEAPPPARPPLDSGAWALGTGPRDPEATGEQAPPPEPSLPTPQAGTTTPERPSAPTLRVPDARPLSAGQGHAVPPGPAPAPAPEAPPPPSERPEPSPAPVDRSEAEIPGGAAILVALRAHPGLAGVATGREADCLAGLLMTAATKLEWAVAKAHEIGAEADLHRAAGMPKSDDYWRSRLARYLPTAWPPKPAPRAAEEAPPPAQAPARRVPTTEPEPLLARSLRLQREREAAAAAKAAEAKAEAQATAAAFWSNPSDRARLEAEAAALAAKLRGVEAA